MPNGQELTDPPSGQFEVIHAARSYSVYIPNYQMNQAKLFENQKTKPGFRRYGASVHYHRVSEDIAVPETHNGARMVQSTLTEMLANVCPSWLLISYFLPREMATRSQQEPL